MSTNMCRVCRSGNMRLLCVENVKLIEIYEKLTSNKFNTDDGRPRTLCYTCNQQLQKCWRFADMANKSEIILTNLLSRGMQVEHASGTEFGLTPMPLSPVPFLTEEADDAQGSTTVKIEQYIEETEDFEFLEIEARNGTDGDFIDIEIGTNVESAIDGFTEFEDCTGIQRKEKGLIKLKEDTRDKTAIDCDFLAINSNEKHADYEKILGNSFSSDKNSYVCCNYCNKKFAFKYQLVTHLMVHTEAPLKTKHHAEGKPYACDKCTETFAHGSALKTHMKTHTEKSCITETYSTETTFSCKICDEAFPTKLKLTTHILTHSEEWSHVCKVCEKAFNKPADLEMHMTNHKKNPYACTICNRDFPKPVILLAHMKMHTAKHTCKVCNKAFAVPAYLKRHMQIHSTERPSFPCLSCDKVYSQKCHLLEHMRTHNGVKPHTCKICDRMFTYRSTLRNHMVIHTGEKPYACNRCDQAFSQTSTLKRHLRLIHSVK